MGRSEALNSVPWAGMFCGRQQELDLLSQAFRRVQTGSGPEIAVIVGESGLGKTRLVQEFYARLSEVELDDNSGGYWPRRLVRDQNNLRINPDPSECKSDSGSRLNYLWWGLRLHDPGAHNSGLGGLAESAGFLRAHLEPFAKARLLAARMKSAATAAAVDVAIEVGNVFTFGLLGLGKLGLDHGSEVKSILEERSRIGRFDPAEAGSRQQQNIVDIVIEDLGALFSSKAENGTPLPAIILLDDAQWLAGDPTTCRFIAQLISTARAKSWPILMLATHWEQEWLQHAAEADDTTFAGMVLEQAPPQWQPIKLSKELELADMVRAGLPGLTENQIAFLVEKADGNPRLMDEILRDLLDSPGLFEDFDCASPLSPEAAETIAEGRFELHQLVQKRLTKSPPGVQLAVSLSSLQGTTFVDRLTTLAMEILGKQDGEASLGRAENPHSLINPIDPGSHEFAQGVYREVARDRLAKLVPAAKAAGLIKTAIRKMAGPSALFADLPEGTGARAAAISAELLTLPGGEEDGDPVLALRCWRRSIEDADARYDDDAMTVLLDRAAKACEQVAVGSDPKSLSDIAYILRMARRLDIADLQASLAALLLKQLSGAELSHDTLENHLDAMAILILVYPDKPDLLDAQVSIAGDLAQNETPENLAELAFAYIHRARFLARKGATDELEADSEKALRILNSLDQDASLEVRIQTAWGHVYCGEAYYSAGNAQIGKRLLELGETLFRAVRKLPELDERENKSCLRGLSTSLRLQTLIARRQKRPQDALRLQSEACQVLEATEVADPDRTNRLALAAGSLTLAKIARELRQFTLARESLHRTQEIYRQLALGDRSPRYLIGLARTLLEEGDLTHAEQDQQGALKLWSEVIHAVAEAHNSFPSEITNSLWISTLNRMGMVCRIRGEKLLAKEHFETALQRMECWSDEDQYKHAKTIAGQRAMIEELK